MESPAAALRRARLAAGLTQAETAEAMGVSEAYVWMLERGLRAIRAELAYLMPEPIGAEVRKALAGQHRLAAQLLDPP